jgi:hypothetical protein
MEINKAFSPAAARPGLHNGQTTANEPFSPRPAIFFLPRRPPIPYPFAQYGKY